jgi:hypothetical protein
MQKLLMLLCTVGIGFAVMAVGLCGKAREPQTWRFNETKEKTLCESKRA